MGAGIMVVKGFKTDFRIDFGNWGFWIPTFVGMTVGRVGRMVAGWLGLRLPGDGDSGCQPGRRRGNFM